MIEVVGISGSLRKQSVNTAVLRAAGQLMPSGSRLTLASLADLPLYDGDLDVDDGPAAVRALKQQVADADALLISTPEYNYSVPGVLKNAIDWLSRPAYRSVLAGKPVAIVGASGGVVGTARAQQHLKTVMLSTLAEVFPYPEVLVGSIKDKLDTNGELTDPTTREILAKMLASYSRWLEPRIPSR